MNKAKYTNRVPEDRKEVVEVIKKLKKPVKVMIIGSVDSGKTTLTVFLANELLKEGLRVGIIDSDIGQKGILPPAVISLGFPEGVFTSLDEIKAEKHYFVGSITPNQFFGEMITGVKILVNEAIKRADVILIDTTGLVHGPGVELKRMKIEVTNPDIIIALQKKDELENITRPFEDKKKIFRLRISENARIHTREERRKIRRDKWKRYFKESHEWEIDLHQINISGTLMFQGAKITEEEKNTLERLFRWIIFHGRKISNKYFVVKADIGNFPRGFDRNTLVTCDFEKLSNLIVGLIDRQGFCVGLGILKIINFNELKAHLMTPLNKEELEKITEIRLGRIRVREDGEELGLLPREAL
ncbi:polyhydroxyalkanoate depolymerase [Thermococcus sp. MV5]|uniref:Clp1/GlmU family protein n=1 Tax=Thermococcus sp. MV5 TaxID=1638272 RepID=UPI00143B5352|nr:Clp1/GlmU family protein [Thermococcus sp. MV5]NJE25086.1 polyhydroxyalkanoate depolymerase [Thermococcus sp. MV5]